MRLPKIFAACEEVANKEPNTLTETKQVKRFSSAQLEIARSIFVSVSGVMLERKESQGLRSIIEHIVSRVLANSVHFHFVVEMRPCAATAVAYGADDFSPLHVITRMDFEFVQVRIASTDTVTVIENEHLAETAAVGTEGRHSPGGRDDRH